MVVLFEVWNLMSMVEGLGSGQKESKIRRVSDAASAAADLSYATLRGAADILGNQNVLGQALNNLQIRLGRKLIIPALPTLGVGAAFGSAALSFMDMLDNTQEGDYDAAFGHGLAAAGFAGFGLTLLGSIKILANTKFLWLFRLGALAPYGWAALSLVLLGVVIANALDDAELEEWAKNGPFAKDGGSEDFRYLREGLEAEKTSYAMLASALFSPKISMRRLKFPESGESQAGDIVVRVDLPRFTIGQDTLDVRAAVRRQQYDVLDCHGQRLGPQETLFPYQVKQFTDENGSLTAKEYFYQDTSGLHSAARWLAKARVITAEQVVLPDPKRRRGTGQVIDPEGKMVNAPARRKEETEEEYQERLLNDPDYQQALHTIDKNAPGWVFDELNT